MANKIYAVKRGKVTGIFKTWEECKASVDGFPGAEHKSFKTMEEAYAYLERNCAPEPMEVYNPSNSGENMKKLFAYVDGSYNSATEEFSYGMVVLFNGQEHHLSQKYNDKDLASMNNVAGEIKGAEAAMRYALENQFTDLTIYHDYEGIAKWCNGEWKANKEGTRKYKAYYDSIKDKINIVFIKVAGHSNDKYNDMADELAKRVLGIGVVVEKQPSSQPSVEKSIYLIRNLDELNHLLSEVGKLLWPDFKTEGILISGNHHRLPFVVDGKNAFLDIYQKNDGTTTLTPTGSNMDLSSRFKEAIELRGYKTTSDVKSYTIFLTDDCIRNVIGFLSGLCKDNYDMREDTEKTIHQFVSVIGDKLTLTIFKDNKVLIQGKPLLLYNEFLSYISYSPKVEMNDIIKVTNTFSDTNANVETTRERLAELMPTAYRGKVHDVIWKLFSPALVLIEGNKILEDYTCYVFPVLRALEGYLQFLLGEKNIIIDKKHDFGTVFKPDSSGSTTFIVINKYITQIGSQSYKEVLEEIYNYFRMNRHVLFHVDQIFISTRLIEDKQEAVTLVYEIANLIEDTYKKAFI